MIQAGGDMASDYYKYRMNQDEKERERKFYTDLFNSFNKPAPAAGV